MAKSIWEALTGRTRQPSTVRDQLADLYGTDSRGRIHTRAAAEELGVSQRTVQRWIRQGKLPANDNGQHVLRRHDDWKNSALGRSQEITSHRDERLRSGATLFFQGRLRISEDVRTRTISQQPLTASQMSTILDAARSGDDDAARNALQDAISEEYYPFTIVSIDSIRFTTVDGE